MTVLIKKVYPESQRRAQARSSEQERFRRSFSRRLPENARSPALRAEEDGERGAGRGGTPKHDDATNARRAMTPVVTVG